LLALSAATPDKLRDGIAEQSATPTEPTSFPLSGVLVVPQESSQGPGYFFEQSLGNIRIAGSTSTPTASERECLKHPRVGWLPSRTKKLLLLEQ
jgi:hypothetical protein